MPSRWLWISLRPAPEGIDDLGLRPAARENRRVKPADSECAFADTVPDAWADRQAGAWFAAARPGRPGAAAQTAVVHEIDTSLSLPTRQRPGTGFRSSQDPYGCRSSGRGYGAAPNAITIRGRWFAWSLVSAAATIVLATVLMS